MYVPVPFTKYDLQIAGYTSKGVGPLSDVYPILTDVTGLLWHSFACSYPITITSTDLHS